MNDGYALLVWSVGIPVFIALVMAIHECMERRQQRHEEDLEIGMREAAAGDGAAATGAQSPPLSSIVLTVLDYVSMPRQHQGGPSAGDGSTTAAERPECVFCLGELEDSEVWVVLKTCQHEFHRKCMAKWLEEKKSNCPICRAVVWPKKPALADMV